MAQHPPCWTWPGRVPGLFLSDRQPPIKLWFKRHAFA
jgi:hypothetical protein